MSEPVRILYEATQKTSYLKVKFLDGFQGSEKKEYLTQIYIDDSSPNIRDEMELCRFKLQKGARLRNEYTDFNDFYTEFDTINRIHVPFASPFQSTICPEILKTFAKTMMEYSGNNPWDCSFCLNCLKLEQGMNYEELKGYLNLRLKEKIEHYSTHDMYFALRKILEMTKTGTTYHTSTNGDSKIMLL